MRPSAVIDKAREAAAEFVAKHHGTPTLTYLSDAFCRAIPQRDRVPGDELVFRAAFKAEVARSRAK